MKLYYSKLIYSPGIYAESVSRFHLGKGQSSVRKNTSLTPQNFCLLLSHWRTEKGKWGVGVGKGTVVQRMYKSSI